MTLVRPRPRPSGTDALKALLEAERFRLGPGTARLAHNLAAHGGLVDDRAPAWVGDDLPPLNAPSVTLGDRRGTLGPHSFGFLDNRRGVAPLAAPLPVRPPVGTIALVCGRREALPDVGPLCASRGLGVSWIVSVGDGDAEALLAYLGADPGTGAVLLAAPSVRAGALSALQGKPAVLLGGDPLLRAAVRRAGGVATDDLEAWLAHGALLGCGQPRPRRPAAVVLGAGAALAREALRSAGGDLHITTVPDDDPDELERLLGEVEPAADLLLVVGTPPLPRPTRPVLLVDIGFPDRLRALGGALALVGAPAAAPVAAPRTDRAQAQALLAEAGNLLGDHDAKRLLKLHGARVSRQAPANSATAALRVGGLIGLPVDVVAPASSGQRDPLAATIRRARTTAELRRLAAVLLDEVPYVLVREAFPAEGRVRLSVRRDRGLGAYAMVGAERALLPLSSSDARLLARAAVAAAPGEEAALVELIAACASCAHEESLQLDVELCTSGEPAVVGAAAERLSS